MVTGCSWLAPTQCLQTHNTPRAVVVQCSVRPSCAPQHAVQSAAHAQWGRNAAYCPPRSDGFPRNAACWRSRPVPRPQLCSLLRRPASYCMFLCPFVSCACHLTLFSVLQTCVLPVAEWFPCAGLQTPALCNTFGWPGVVTACSFLPCCVCLACRWHEITVAELSPQTGQI